MAITVESVEQITLFLENRTGILADLCAHLSDHSINIRAISTHEGADTGSVRLLVNEVERAKKVLADAGVPFSSGRCLAMEMPNSPGGFADIARRLAVAGVNIEYIYASGTATAATALGVFGVSDLERALAVDWS